MKPIVDTKFPPLRFKDNEGKRFPEWRCVSLGEILIVRYGKDHKHLSKGEVPVFGTGGIIRYANSALHSQPSVLIGRKGTIDNPQFIEQPFWAVDTLFYTEIAASNVPYFVYLIVLRINWKRYNEATGLPSLNVNSINRIRVNIPSKEEQQKIASFLSSINTRIEQLEKKKSLFELYKKGIMQKLFSQEIRFTDDQGNEYPEWEYKAIKEIGEIVTGKTPTTTDKSLWNGNLKFITPTDISDSRKYQTNVERYIRKSKNTRIIPPYSIIYTCIASIGKICISTEDCATNQQINAIIPYSRICNEFVYYCLLYATPRIKATQGNSTLPIINKSQFERIKLLFPCFSEQQKVADCLSSIDRKIELISEQIKKTREFKKGLLQQMFV